MSTSDPPTPPAAEETVVRGPDGRDDSSLERTVRLSAPGSGVHSPADDPRAGEGRPFGRYRLLGELGRGGVGVVWKAWDTQLRRLVALKQIAGNASTDRSQAERFLREAQLAAKLSHPNIVAVHDVGEQDGQPFYTSEFIEGRSLEEAMRESAPPARRVAWVRGIADALAYAHEQGIIHRDVKPGNVLLDVEGRPRVTDFGLAKEVHSASGTAPLTLSGQIVGTPSYMSPEQAMGRADLVGPATDQFSLGVVLYQMLVDRRPFDAPALRDVLNRIIEDDPIPPTRLCSGVHRDLEAICLRALEKDPSRRYPSMREMAADLGRFLDGEPILARPVSRARRLLRRLARNRVAAIAVAAATLVTLGVLVLGAIGWARHAADVAEALSAAEKAEEAAPRGDARRLLAEARDAYARVLGQDENNVAALRGLSRVKARLEEIEEASESARREALQLLEAGRPVLDQAARALYDERTSYADLQSRVGSAQKVFQQAIDKDPSLALGHHLMGRAWEMLGWEDKAEACWRRALSLDPGFFPSRLALAHLRLMQAFVTKQEAHSSGSPMLEAETRRLIDEARDLLEARGAKPREGLMREDALTLQACRAMRAYVVADGPGLEEACAEGRNRFAGIDGVEVFDWLDGLRLSDEEEREAYDRAIARRPKFPLALYTRAEWFLAHAQAARAVEDFTRAIEVNPRFAAAYVARGCAWAAEGDFHRAAVDFTKTIEIEPSYGSAWGDRAQTKLQIGDLPGALADIEEAISREPKSATYRVERASIRRASGDERGAREDVDQAIAIEPRNTAALTARGTIRAEGGELEGALSDIDAVLDVDPTNAVAREVRGQVLLATDRAKEAEADFTVAIAARPGRAELLVGRGLARQRLGNLNEAIADYDAALAIDPEAGTARANRAAIRVQRREWDGVLGDTEALLKTRPRDGLLLFYHGLARAAKGDTDGAIEDEEAAIAAATKDDAWSPDAHKALVLLFLVRSRGAAGGDLDAAYRHLKAWVASGRVKREDLEASKELAPMRSDPRWKEIVR